MLQDAPVPHQGQCQSAHPWFWGRNRSGLMWLMTWLTHHCYLLTWPASKERTSVKSRLTLTAPLTTNSPESPHNDGNQHCSTVARGAHPKTCTAESTKPMSAVWAKPRHRRMTDPVEHADDWIQAQVTWDPWYPSWLWELKVIYRECTGECSETMALQLTLQQATAFWLSIAQEEASQWWETPHSNQGLGHQDFLSHVDFPGKGISSLWDKIKPWHWSKLCSDVQSNMGHLSESFVMQHRIFRGVWDPWCLWR